MQRAFSDASANPLFRIGEDMLGQIFSKYGACGALLALAGCASVPPPTEQLAIARTTVSQAQAATATQHAPVELRAAQSKLDRAQAAMQREQYLEAKRLAEQAEVDAKFAWAKSETAKAQMAVAELEEGIRVLHQELQRRAPGQ
jgi:hypothetical protein